MPRRLLSFAAGLSFFFVLLDRLLHEQFSIGCLIVAALPRLHREIPVDAARLPHLH